MMLSTPIRSQLRRSAPAALSRLLSLNMPQKRSFSEVQKKTWESYLATGRGSRDLFGSIDKDHDGKLSKSDVKTFVEAVERSDVLIKALHLLDHRAEDHPLDFNEFQEWLISSTQHVVDACIHPLYEESPHIGERRPSSKKQEVYTWNESTMCQALRRMQYAVRGEVVMAAEKLASEGKEIIYTNIGNPHAVGQKPITYYRQVLSLCDLPAEVGVDHPIASQLFPKDVLERARELRDLMGIGGTGAYTHSQGVAGIRQHVADFIAERDGHPAFPGDIFLTNGASSGIELILEGLISCNRDAIMIPIPQYPIYSALITRLGGRQLGYELEESIGWGVTQHELLKRLEEAKDQGLTVKGLALINPGNPTGQVMQRSDLETICKFCADNGIVLMADEVYQKNVYAPNKEFISAKKVATETKGCESLQLISFHSTSKGLIGECGRRGGYMELHNIDPYVQSQIYKLASSGLCSCTAGQIVTSLMVRGPAPGDESYDLFMKEEGKIFESLGKRAHALVDGLNSIEGIECQPAEGAMYAFPKLDLPPMALEKAKANKQTPDTLYALSLLEETGICVVPASGFGQKQGRVGFRTNFSPTRGAAL